MNNDFYNFGNLFRRNNRNSYNNSNQKKHKKKPRNRFSYQQTSYHDSRDTFGGMSYDSTKINISCGNNCDVSVSVGGKYNCDSDPYYTQTSVPTADECYERILENRRKNGGRWL